MAVSRKRKYQSKGRIFNENWTSDYFFIEYEDKPMCLICMEVLAVFKEYNLQRHHESKHKQEFDCLEGELRDLKINSLKSSLINQQNTFKKVRMQNEAPVRASYIVAREIAKSGRPFEDSEFIKKMYVGCHGRSLS